MTWFNEVDDDSVRLSMVSCLIYILRPFQVSIIFSAAHQPISKQFKIVSGLKSHRLAFQGTYFEVYLH